VNPSGGNLHHQQQVEGDPPHVRKLNDAGQLRFGGVF
jgi:hypothetical protein